MSSFIIKLIYLFSGAFLGVGAAKRKKIKNTNFVLLALCSSMAFCFVFWGISTIFHLKEGYPPQWFFYLTSLPVFITSIIVLINIEK